MWPHFFLYDVFAYIAFEPDKMAGCTFTYSVQVIKMIKLLFKESLFLNNKSTVCYYFHSDIISIILCLKCLFHFILTLSSITVFKSF